MQAPDRRHRMHGQQAANAVLAMHDDVPRARRVPIGETNPGARFALG